MAKFTRYSKPKKPKGTKAKRHKQAKRIQAAAKHIRQNGGQPSTYDPLYAKMIKPLCEKGATDEEIADFFSVTITTVRNWMVRHQEFFAACQGGKDAWDQRIERTLALKAAGYTFQSEKIVVCDKEVVRVPVLEHVPPSDAAMKLWLTNRKPMQWKDRTTNEFDPDKPLKIIVEGGLPK